MGDRQVFGDTSGRRARWVIFFEIALGLAAVAMAALVTLALLTTG
jgi:hypothetical protein